MVQVHQQDLAAEDGMDTTTRYDNMVKFVAEATGTDSPVVTRVIDCMLNYCKTGSCINARSD